MTVSVKRASYLDVGTIEVGSPKYPTYISRYLHAPQLSKAYSEAVPSSDAFRRNYPYLDLNLLYGVEVRSINKVR